MRSLLRSIGSLKLAVVVLGALAVAMALASLYESQHGTEAALRVYYHSGWFAALMALLGVNILAALIVRWPFKRSQAGFVLAHLAVLVILVGALVSRLGGVDGRLWLRPGESRSSFDGDQWEVSLRAPEEGEAIEVPIGATGPVVDSAVKGRTVDGVSMVIEEFAQDTVDEGERVIADPNSAQPAVKLRLGHGGQHQEEWLMGGQRPVLAGRLQLRLIRVTNPEMLAALLKPSEAPTAPNEGKLPVEMGSKVYPVEVRAKMNQVVPLGETGYRVRVTRYVPHAQVMGREIRSATSRPVNPMIEFELIDPVGKAESHRLFARFPEQDFAAMHRATSTSAPATAPATFRYTEATLVSGERNRIDLLLDADNKLHVRFADSEGQISSTDVALDKPIQTPWKETDLTVLEVVPHARAERELKPIPPRKEDALPAAFVCLRTDATAHRLWVRKGESYDVQIAGKSVQVSFVPARMPLGFSIKLIEPIITHYPGSNRPRTYESRVQVDDAARGLKLEKTIRMNAPLSFGGYSFYQSSYQFGQNGQPVASMLSVVSDPGEPIVYAGYFGLMIGMVIVLFQKVSRYRRAGGSQKT